MRTGCASGRGGWAPAGPPPLPHPPNRSTWQRSGGGGRVLNRGRVWLQAVVGLLVQFLFRRCWRSRRLPGGPRRPGAYGWLWGISRGRPWSPGPGPKSDEPMFSQDPSEGPSRCTQAPRWPGWPPTASLAARGTVGSRFLLAARQDVSPTPGPFQRAFLKSPPDTPRLGGCRPQTPGCVFWGAPAP